MAWPKGVPRKKRETLTVEEAKAELQGAAMAVHIEPDEQLEKLREERKDGFPIPEGSAISVTSRKRVSLLDSRYDPATKFKTDPKMYYRYIPQRARERSMREAEGFVPVPGSEFGDMILAKLPKEDHQDMVMDTREKTERQTKAAVEQFKETGDRFGVQVDDETHR